MSVLQNTEVSGSCGIRKIIGCRLSEGGKLFYKVKWEPTWEPEENLSICCNLVSDFWSYVNHAKTEQLRKHEMSRKRPRLDPDLSISSSPIVMSPSQVNSIASQGMASNIGSAPRSQFPPLFDNALSSWQPGQAYLSSQPPAQLRPSIAAQAVHSTTPELGTVDIPTAFKDLLSSSQVRTPKKAKKMIAANIKTEEDDFKPASPSSAIDTSTLPSAATRQSLENLASSSLQYLENFTNPYVKIVLVCRICNKEQSMKKPGNWKAHFLIHVSDDEKPYKCTTCGKAFIRQDVMKTHMEKKHGLQ